MYLANAGMQSGRYRSYRADGSLSTTAPKLILPETNSRAMLLIQNTGTVVIWVENGCARATATLSSGTVNAVTVTNGGFGFTQPPNVEFKGGGGAFAAPLTASAWNGVGQIDQWPTPSGVNTLVTPPVYSRPAQGHAVLTSGVVTSIVIDDPGAGYIYPPEVHLTNHPLDPWGCADPSVGSGSGYQLAEPGGTYLLNASFCHTNAVAVYAATAASFYLEYAP